MTPTLTLDLAALFERTGGRVPSKETKTYLGAGLAVLGVNLVSMQHTAPFLQVQAKPPPASHPHTHLCCCMPGLTLLLHR